MTVDVTFGHVRLSIHTQYITKLKYMICDAPIGVKYVEFVCEFDFDRKSWMATCLDDKPGDNDVRKQYKSHNMLDQPQSEQQCLRNAKIGSERNPR